MRYSRMAVVAMAFLTVLLGLARGAALSRRNPRRSGTRVRVVGSDGVSAVAGIHARMLTTAGEVLARGTTANDGFFCVEKLPPGRHVLQVGDPGLRASIGEPTGGVGLEVTVIMPPILNVPADASAALATPVRPSAAAAYESGGEVLVVPVPFRGKESLLGQRWEPPVVGSTAPGRGGQLE